MTKASPNSVGPDRFWKTIDFKPAPPGWRVVFLRDRQYVESPATQGFRVMTMAGWLVQEASWVDLVQTDDDEFLLVDRETPKNKQHLDGHRRVVPAVHGRDGHLKHSPYARGFGTLEVIPASDIDDAVTLWRVLGPDSPVPDSSEIEKAWAEQERIKEYNATLNQHIRNAE